MLEDTVNSCITVFSHKRQFLHCPNGHKYGEISKKERIIAKTVVIFKK